MSKLISPTLIGKKVDWLIKEEDIQNAWAPLLKYFGKEWVTEKIEQNSYNFKKPFSDEESLFPKHEYDKCLPSITTKMKERICDLLLLDYCCLNYKLPDFCDSEKHQCAFTFDGKILPLKDL